MSEESEAKSLKESRLKHVASMVASAVALVTAVSAFVRPQDQSVNQESYETLTVAIKQLSEQTKQNHDDLLALRGYTEAAVHIASASEVSIMPAADGGTKISAVPRPVVRIRRPPPMSVADAGVKLSSHFGDMDGGGTFVAHNFSEAEPLPEPPPLGDSPQPVDPPSFPDVVRKAAAKK